jgi:predicted house-cleaning noncanonical NTP pyrophosphatase (MazG superfamily)
VLGTLSNFIASNGDAGFAYFSTIIESLTEEVIEELNEKDDETLASFMDSMGEVIAWIGHGDNSRLPEQLRMFAEEVQPSLVPVEASV